MFGKRVQYALDNFIDSDYFSDMSHIYHLEEKEDSGKSDLKVIIECENLCISDFDHKKKCNFLRVDRKYGMQKSVDHVLFEYRTGSWRLHLIEMKSSVGYQTWLEKVKPKVRTSYLTSLAIAKFLGIEISETFAYTTYETDKFSDGERKANPRMIFPFLGQAAHDALKDEWQKDRMFLNLGDEIVITHKKIHMIKNNITGILEGSLAL